MGRVHSSDQILWLHQHTLFRALPLDVLKHLGPMLCQERYTKGESIFNELKKSPHELWALKEGHVRLIRYSSSGHAFALRVVTPGGVFCIPAVMGQCQYPCHAIADTNVVLLKVPASSFRQLLGRYPALGCEALKIVCQDCCQSHALCVGSQERAEQRILTVLVHLLGSFGATIPLSRQQIAELAGMSRETANRILLKLQRIGVVALSFQRLTIRNPARLRSLLEQPS